jgi:hypothetical protein
MVALDLCTFREHRMSTRHIAAGLTAALALAGVASLARPERPAERITAPSDAAGAAALAGTASCSARGCHGAVGPADGDGPRLNEYTVWLGRDPHARAYQALLGPRARRMAKNLAAANPEGREIPAHEDGRCLACHANPLAAGPAHKERRAEGVGCEACHGPAKGDKPWLETHATTSWRGLRPEQKAVYGMAPLEDPAAQARTCAGCHVGASADPGHGLPSRDLNHDLIAAGHPRLQFELAAYRANLPAHWRPDKYVRSDPGYDARLWAVGQVVSARVSLELLLDRAREGAAPTRPWPEFAEYSCFACHAEIQGLDWRRPAHLGRRKPGSLPYTTWYSSLLPVLLPRGDALSATFEELGLALSRPSPDRNAVAGLAGKAVGQLDALLGAVREAPYDRAGVRALLGSLAARAGRAPARSWDEKEQFALSVAALAQADRTLARAGGGKPLLGPEVDLRLRALFRALAFPPGSEGPPGPRRDTGADGPMNELLKALSAGGGR